MNDTKNSNAGNRSQERLLEIRNLRVSFNVPGGAVNAYEAQRREEALRPLMAACRQALVVACNAPLDGR